jgi:TPR repeat protein
MALSVRVISSQPSTTVFSENRIDPTLTDVGRLQGNKSNLVDSQSYGKYEKVDKALKALGHFERGKKLYEQKECENAASAFILALSLNPKYKEAWTYLKLCLENQINNPPNVPALSVSNLSSALPQYILGNCYYFGRGVLKNDTEAVKWYQKAAEQGNAEAQFSLGNCYYFGCGVPKNDTEAVNWYRKAAEQGNVLAQALLHKLALSSFPSRL